MLRRMGIACALAFAACGGAAGLEASPDATAPDAAAAGATAADAASSDAGAPDAAAPDAPGEDASAHDAGHPDAAEEDAGAFEGPRRLSETGLYADIRTRTLAARVLPYDVRHELWSDGAAKQRWLLLPAGTTIDDRDLDHWRFPVGTKVWKEFSSGGRAVETRLLEKRSSADLDWLMVAYVWSDDGSDAIAAPDGATDARGTTHDVPSRDQCLTCHRGVADVVIGISAFQLPEANARAWSGLFAPPLARTFDPPGTGLVRDTLGYVHANCGHCHNDRHPLSRFFPLRLRLTTSSTRAEDTGLYRTAINVRAQHRFTRTATIVVPGAPERSQLYFRMSVRSEEQMPPIATSTVDRAGLARVRDWILSLPL